MSIEAREQAATHRHRWEQRWEWSSRTCTFKVFQCATCPQFKACHYGCHNDAEMSDDLLAQLKDREEKLAAVEEACMLECRGHTPFPARCLGCRIYRILKRGE